VTSEGKHYFPSEELKETGLRKQLTSMLTSVQMDFDAIEEKVNMFEQKIEKVLSKLDDLEERISKLEQLLE